MKVLVAIDGSASSRAVVEQLASRPWPEGTEFCVLTVMDIYVFEQVLAWVPGAAKAAEDLVRTAAEQLRKTGRQVTTSVLEGHPASIIVEAAEQQKADLIVVGSRGLGGISRFWLGSVASAVVRNARCSVEIVRAGGEEAPGGIPHGLRVLLATDGSECSTVAVKSAAQRPWPGGTEFRVVCVPELVVPGYESSYVNVEPWETLREESVTRAKEAVACAVKTLREARSNADGTVLTAPESPKTQILDEAKKWGAQLIVVGSHGRRGLDRFLLGSVSEAVALHAQSSVEVIRGRRNGNGKGDAR
jgi:nucleotide-binding universal stress UspA family protein